MPVSVTEWPDFVPEQNELVFLSGCFSSLKEKKHSLKKFSFLMLNHLYAGEVKRGEASSLTGKTFFIFTSYRPFKMR